MKVVPTKKIQEFQQGGSLNQYFTIFRSPQSPKAASPQAAAQTKTKKDDSSKDDITKKDLFDMVKDVDGLPMEMLSVIESLSSTLRMANLTGLSSHSDLTSTYLDSLWKIKVLSENKTRFKEAKKEAENNGAWAEPAIALNGDLVTQDAETGKLKTVSLKEYHANPDAYRILTVAQLGYLREWDPKLNFDQDTFDIMRNSMGYESFQKLLKQAIDSLGTTTIKYNGYATNEGQASKGWELLKGLPEEDVKRALQAGSVAEGLYQYSSMDSSQIEQIKALTAYLVQALPRRARTWAALKTGSDNPDTAIGDFVLRALLSRNNVQHEFKIDYKGTMDHVMGISSKGNGSSKEEEPKMTFLTALQMGYGNETETRVLNPGGQVSFHVEGTAYGSFIGTNGKTLSNLTLQQLLSETGLAGITNSSSIYFGNQRLTPNQLGSIAIENNGGFYAILPCKRQGNNIVPNFDLIDAYEKAVQRVNGQISSNITKEQYDSLIEREIAKVPELKELLNMSGKLDWNKVCPFFIVDGIASDISIDFGENSTRKLISRTEDKNDLKYFLSTTKLSDEFKDGWWDSLFGNETKVYKSNVFIPIRTNNRLAAVLSSGQKVKDSTALKLEGEYQQARHSDMRSNSSQMLQKGV